MKTSEESRTAYLADGRTVEVVAETDAGIVIRYGYESEDGEQYFDVTDVVQRVYDVPPTEHFDEQIVNLRKQRDELNQEISKLRSELREAQSKHDEAMKRLIQYPTLKRIEDFLAGRITHFVITNWNGISILTKEEALKSDEYNGRGKLRLLTLFGQSNGDLQWMINKWSDGSGYDTVAMPCTSHDDAVAYATLQFNELWEKFRKGDIPHSLSELVKSAKTAGIEVPAEVTEFIRNNQLKSLNKQREETMLRVARIEADIAAIAGGAA